MKKRKPCTVFMAAIAAFVVAAACSQPAGGTPVPVITITVQPTAHTEVMKDSISGSLSVAATVTESAVLACQWYRNTSESNEGGTAINGATEVSFTIPTDLAADVYYFFCEITAPGADPKRSDVATITVLSTGTPYINITVQPAVSTEVMEGYITGSLSVTASGINGATVTGYQWYKNTTASNEGGTTIDGATTEEFTIPTDLAADVYYYFCEITASGGAAPKRSNVATVRVVLNTGTPFITITIQPAAATEVTEGYITGSLSVTVDGINGAIVTGYQWYRNTTASKESGTLVPGAVMPSFSIPADLAEGAYYYFCEIAASAEAASVRSDVATVTVRPRPVVTITSQPEEDTAVKVGAQTGSLSVSATVPGAGGLYYQWYENTSASNEGGYPLSGATSSSFALPYYSTPGEYFYYCQIMDYYGGAVYSTVATVTVSSAITITAQPVANTPVQAGAITGSLSVAAEGTENAVLAYQWYSNTSEINVGGGTVPGATDASFTIPTNLTPGVYYYYCEITVSGGVDSKRSDVATVTVSSVITITAQPVTNTPVQAGKIAGSLSVTAMITEGESLSYQWFKNTTASNEGGSILWGETSSSFAIPTNLTPDTYYYFCEITATGGAVPKRSSVAKVTVSNPDTEFVITISDIDDPELVGQIAGAAPTTDTPFSAGGSDWKTYQWYVDGIAQADATSVDYTFNQPTGVYNLTIVVTDTAGDTYSGTCWVTVR